LFRNSALKGLEATQERAGQEQSLINKTRINTTKWIWFSSPFPKFSSDTLAASLDQEESRGESAHPMDLISLFSICQEIRIISI
jgi:hypothetical protein